MESSEDPSIFGFNLVIESFPADPDHPTQVLGDKAFASLRIAGS